jgi:hypothetical protein
MKHSLISFSLILSFLTIQNVCGSASLEQSKQSLAPAENDFYSRHQHEGRLGSDQELLVGLAPEEIAVIRELQAKATERQKQIDALAARLLQLDKKVSA